jgi:hypothetical protein
VVHLALGMHAFRCSIDMGPHHHILDSHMRLFQDGWILAQHVHDSVVYQHLSTYVGMYVWHTSRPRS